jgi:Predicted membrane protein
MVRKRDPSHDRQIDQQHEDSQEFTLTAQRFSGPLPHPAILAQYNDVIPGGAERVIAMAERNQQHRHAMESMVVRGGLSAQRNGQWFGLIVALVGMAGSIWLISQGQTWGGAAIGTVDVVGLVSLFIYSNESKKKELRSKAGDLIKPLPGP